MMKNFAQKSLIAAIALAAGCSQTSSHVEFRGTPLPPANERALARAVQRANGGRYERVVVTISDRVVAVRK